MILTHHGINSLLRTQPEPSGDYITIGDKIYHYVQFTNLLITIENLDSDIPGIRLATSSDPILPTEVKSGSIAVSTYYNYDEDTYGPSGLNYGRLYNGGAFLYIAAHLDSLVPNGWTIGSALQNLSNVSTGQGIKSTTGWNNDANGENLLQLNVVPTGYVTLSNNEVTFRNVGSYGYIPYSCNSSNGLMQAVSVSESTVGTTRPGSTGCYFSGIRFYKSAPQVEIGGVNYGTTRIGNQLWTTENIAIVYNGLSVCDANHPLNTYDSTNAQAAYYDYDSSKQSNGLLYNWPAVNYIANHLEDLGITGGWRVPTATDLTNLMNYVSTMLYPGSALRGTEFSRPGTNSFRFNLLPSGYWNGTSFVEYGDSAGLWSATSESGTTATCRYTTVVPYNFDFNAISASKYCCYSVRLVKDFVYE